MGMFLNSTAPYEFYRGIAEDPFFVDKSLLLEEMMSATERREKYLCITRPRRFGKSIAANMVSAFLGKGADGKEIFDRLRIAGHKDYDRHRNRHNVIFVDFSRLPRDCDSYRMYIDRIQDGINLDLAEAYPDLTIDGEGAVWDNLSKVFLKHGERFVFVMDEWDAVFHMPFVSSEDQRDYLLFLKNLLKDQVYVELAYMTGVLPIAKYSSGSELNMFLEYDMATKKKFGEYFGFSDDEVDDLYARYLVKTEEPVISRDDLRSWYDGYYTARGVRMYNPRSIVCALTDNELANYWTSSGPYDEIFYYVKNNIDAIRDDLVLMVAGEGVCAEIQNYAAASMQLETRDEIYSAMVVYGLLTYENGKVFIPNHELMEQYGKLLRSKDSLGYVYSLAKESERMLKATLCGDTKTMAEILKFAHDTESSVFQYNSETELSAVVNLVYLAARDRYHVEREDKAGVGYVDFIFYPQHRGDDGIILELKIDSTPEKAIQQIKDRRYALRFKGKLGENPKHTGRILAAGISYDRKTKVHRCKVEVLEDV